MMQVKTHARSDIRSSMMIARLFALWVEGLVAALASIEALLRRPRRFQLSATSQPLKLYSLSHFPPKLLSSIDGGHFGEPPTSILEQTRGGVVEIVVPTSAILHRRMDVLPAESLPYLETVVRHQMDTSFPWPAAEVLFSIGVEKRADGKLDVSVHATSRSAIASALAVAEACGASEIFVVGDGESGEQRTSILAAIGTEKRARLDRLQLVARYSAIALLVLAGFMMTWTTFAAWSLSTEVAALDRDIADRRAILKRAIDASGAAETSSIEAKKRLSTATVVVLDELSALLPENTYLTDLTLEAGRLRLTGVSANAAGLVPLLEGSGHFKNAAFYAPTTRLPDGATDRFSIEATLLTPPVTR
jgi:general secretion pathway protein L